MDIAAKVEAMSIPEPNSGCWLFLGTPSQRYGQISDGRKIRRAHVVAWECRNGRPVPPGMFVCHKCDVPICVNPDHLFIGTPLDNMRDMIAKGRAVHIGPNHSTAKMSPEDVREIRAKRMTITATARAFGISTSAVKRIRSGRSWKGIR